jgi:hypothetical protein
MTRSSTTAGAFQEARLPVQAKLAAAWTSLMFLYIYVDYLALYKPGFIDDILAASSTTSRPARPSSPLRSRSWPSRAS